MSPDTVGPTQEEFCSEEDSHSSANQGKGVPQERIVRKGPLGNLNPKRELSDLAEICAEAIDDLETYDTAYNHFLKGLEAITKIKAQRVGHKVGPGQLCSLVPTDKRTKPKRLSSMYSPLRKKTRRKRLNRQSAVI